MCKSKWEPTLIRQNTVADWLANDGTYRAKPNPTAHTTPDWLKGVPTREHQGEI